MMDPAVRFTEILNGSAADRYLDFLCALVATTIDHSAEVGSILLGLDNVAALCPNSFDGIVDTLFASGMFAGDGDDYHDPRNSLLHEVLARPVRSRIIKWLRDHQCPTSHAHQEA